MVEVYPLKLGTHEVQSYRFIYLAEKEYMLSTSFNAFFVKDDGKNILVDTGPGSPDTPKNKKYRPGLKQAPDQRIETILKDGFGLEPGDIDIVLTSHLHWDHNGDNHLFDNAEFWVQKREMEYASNPVPMFSMMFDNTPDFTPAYEETDFKLVDGDTEVTEHVSVILLPGHTPGLQCVKVEAGDQTVIMTQDFLPMYFNLENRNPCGIFNSIDEWYSSLEKVEELGDIIIPGHDPAVFERFKGIKTG